MKLILRDKYIIAILGISMLFVLNALWLHSMRSSEGLHSLPGYEGLVSFRSLLLRPSSIMVFVIAVSICLGLIYWRSRSHPLNDRQKITLVCIALATAYGFILTAFFRL
jgi:hypothetical protein